MNKGKVLAIDYGKKMVGLASGDLELGMALPRDVLLNKGRDKLLAEIDQICRQLEVVLVVLGMPDAANPIVKEINQFARALEASGHKVEFVDEDFSSIEAKQMMGDHLGGRLDANAAQVILQRFFDRV